MSRLSHNAIGATVILALLGLWVGSYAHWRSERSFRLLSHRTVFVPDWVPQGGEKLYRPLAAADGWMHDEEVTVLRWDIAYPADRLEEAAQGLKEAVQELGDAVEKSLQPREK